jgi:pimeloyl-ACP methyl ester carboxylesterase
MSFVRYLVFVYLLLVSSLLPAQPMPGAAVERIVTREGVSVPVFAYWQANALASVVLFSGGKGGYGKIGEDGWPSGGNFLIRTGKHWATFPFNVIMVGRPSDGLDLSNGNIRTGEAHALDNEAIFKFVKSRSPQPIWVVGTSMGTISAVAAAIHDRDRFVSGLVLSSSIVSYRVPGAVSKQALEKITVPTLIVHHENDACWACQPYEVRNIVRGLSGVPIKKAIFVSGGSGVTGNTCEPLHHHGFVGQQNETVDQIAGWIIKPKE